MNLSITKRAELNFKLALTLSASEVDGHGRPDFDKLSLHIAFISSSVSDVSLCEAQSVFDLFPTKSIKIVEVIGNRFSINF